MSLCQHPAADTAADTPPVRVMSPLPSPEIQAGATPVTVVRAASGGFSGKEDAVATEEPLEIRVSYEKRGGLRVTRSVSVTMRTPGNDAELACGFLFGEGIVRDAGQIIHVGPPEGVAAGNIVVVSLGSGTEVDLGSLERHFYTTSSCGVCGKTSIEALRLKCKALEPGDAPTMDFEDLLRLPERLRRAQGAFDLTGGLHGAGLFDASGGLICAHEDVGRHNAVDKVIGSRLLAGAVPLGATALAVSGRASFELMQKALMAGIPIFLAVGAPSSLAVKLARQFGATLVGFVREGRFNIYSGAHRVRGADLPR